MTLLKSETNQKEVERRINEFEKRFLAKAKKIIEVESRLLATHLKTKYMGGRETTATSVRKRSGLLSKTTRPIPSKETAEGILGGVSFGTVYAAVHVGPKGQKTTITPKNVSWLTVPFFAPGYENPILKRSGELKTSARELMVNQAGLPFGKTFVAKSKAGNLIIFGTRRITKGARMGEYRGESMPLFILKKQVKVKSRIHPEVFLDWAKKDIKEKFGDAVHVSVG